MSLTLFTPGDKVISTDKLVTSTWTNNVNSFQAQFTSSAQANFSSPTSSGQFFIELFNQPTDNLTGSVDVQCSIAYGHRMGSGSPAFTDNTGSLGIGASKVIYGQYQSLVFRDELTFFQFNTHTPDQIYVININRARYKHSLRPGTLNLHLSASQLNPAYETAGERHEVHLTDDSVTSAGVSQQTALGRQFNIVSGANGIMSGSNLGQVGGSSSYGLFYPDAGIIILNADNFGGQLSASQDPAVSTNINRNHQLLRNVMSGSVGGGGTDDPAGDVFILDSEEKVTSQYYFVRAKNLEYNYTTNPSFVDTTGALNFDSMIDNPTVYITTVGLFNNAGDMVAVAKLSQPVTKDFIKEALIRVKLDY